ncbi:hypothetical protein PVK06_030816 [Gossypium arboreum]|uniref:Uncharacterized protein n=1 Tax=Gossypium arboreum TaxID=29729 RepID=A0ABR0NPJ7_GOSAR|nr:hypothetical protein PVK06_030816 [Gossypium arboreum]
MSAQNALTWMRFADMAKSSPKDAFCSVFLSSNDFFFTDRTALTGSIQSANWGAICYDLLGAISDNIFEGRIEMGWLQDIFSELENDSTELERIQYARAYILEMIGGYLMPNLSQNLVHLRWLLKLVDFRAAGKSS